MKFKLTEGKTLINKIADKLLPDENKTVYLAEARKRFGDRWNILFVTDNLLQATNKLYCIKRDKGEVRIYKCHKTNNSIAYDHLIGAYIFDIETQQYEEK